MANMLDSLSDKLRAIKHLQMQTASQRGPEGTAILLDSMNEFETAVESIIGDVTADNDLVELDKEIENCRGILYGVTVPTEIPRHSRDIDTILLDIQQTRFALQTAMVRLSGALEVVREKNAELTAQLRVSTCRERETDVSAWIRTLIGNRLSAEERGQATIDDMLSMDRLIDHSSTILNSVSKRSMEREMPAHTVTTSDEL